MENRKAESRRDGEKCINKALDEACMVAYALCVWEICTVDEVEDYMSRALQFYEHKYKNFTKREYIDEIAEKWKSMVQKCFI